MRMQHQFSSSKGCHHTGPMKKSHGRIYAIFFHYGKSDSSVLNWWGLCQIQSLPFVEVNKLDQQYAYLGYMTFIYTVAHILTLHSMQCFSCAVHICARTAECMIDLFRATCLVWDLKKTFKKKKLKIDRSYSKSCVLKKMRQYLSLMLESSQWFIGLRWPKRPSFEYVFVPLKGPRNGSTW